MPKWLLIAGGTLLALLALGSLALPSMNAGGIRQAENVQQASNGKQLGIAAQQAALDQQQSGQTGIGFPFETKASTSSEYLQNLVSNGYIKKTDLAPLKADQFVFANTAFNDSPDTILLVSRDYYDTVILKKEKPKKPFVVIRKKGDGQSYNPRWFAEHPDQIGLPPPRDPPFLSP